MRKNQTSKLIRGLIEIVWHFGPQGMDGSCCDNLSMPEFLALEKVSITPNCPVQDIGVKLCFTKSGATRIVNRLEKKGYVQKRRISEDARVCCVAITDEGQKALDAAGNICDSKLEEMISKIPLNSREKVKESLLILANSLT